MGIARPALRVPRRFFAEAAERGGGDVPLIPGFGCDGRAYTPPLSDGVVVAERLAHDSLCGGGRELWRMRRAANVRASWILSHCLMGSRDEAVRLARRASETLHAVAVRISNAAAEVVGPRLPPPRRRGGCCPCGAQTCWAALTSASYQRFLLRVLVVGNLLIGAVTLAMVLVVLDRVQRMPAVLLLGR